MSKTQVATGGISDDAVTIAKATGFGKLGQIVTDNFTGTESTTVLASAGNFTDSSLSASITPTATSSKILVLASINTGA